jgi:outer membrane protein assembly factor BamA
MPLYFLSTTYRVWNQLYMGLGFIGGNVETGIDARFERPGPSSFADVSYDLNIAALEIPLQFDTRDHTTFPREGWIINGRALLYRKDLGSDVETDTFMVSFNNYRPMRERDVLALRLYLRGTGDNAPFFLQSTFGGRTDLRGYVSGRYRDRMMYATQAEYRWQYSDRWIFSGFAGFGEVAEQFSDMGENLLPATGIGVRFVISQKHKVALSADIATGKQEDALFYFGVGEAF